MTENNTPFDPIAGQNLMAAQVFAAAEADRREQAAQRAVDVEADLRLRRDQLDAAARVLAEADLRWSHAQVAQRAADREMAAAKTARREARIAYNRAITRALVAPDTFTSADEENSRP